MIMQSLVWEEGPFGGPTQSSPIFQNDYVSFTSSYINLSLKFYFFTSNSKKFTM